MTRYDQTRAAILAAINAADPTAKAYDRWRFPKDTSYTAWLQLLGVGSYIRGWQFSRTSEPLSRDNSQSGAGRGQIVSLQEQWTIHGWRSIIDNPPTEYEFQNTVDAVVSQLRQHSAVLAMLHPLGGAVESIRVDTIDEVEFGGEQYCHHAQITLILTFPRLQA